MLRPERRMRILTGGRGSPLQAEVWRRANRQHYPVDWTIEQRKKMPERRSAMLGSTHCGDLLHVAPVRSGADLHFYRHGQFVHVFHLLAHQFGEFPALTGGGLEKKF